MAEIANPELEFPVNGETIKVHDALEMLKQLIWRVYSQMEDIHGWEEHYLSFIQRLKAFIANKNNLLEIVTTNYDLLPEMVMYSVGQKTTMPVDFSPIPLPEGYNAPAGCASVSGMGGYKMYTNCGNKNLHKLHGSVNWFVKEGEDISRLFCWDEIFPPFRGQSPILLTPFCTSKDASIPDGYLPLIIPPTMIKQYTIPVISKAWQGASKAIENADRIIFIGYSFPPTDTIMKFFLGTSLANNRKGCRISIIDRSAHQVMESLKTVFANNMSMYIDPIEVEFKDLFSLPQFYRDTTFIEYLQD